VDRQASWLLRVPARLSAAEETELVGRSLSAPVCGICGLMIPLKGPVPKGSGRSLSIFLEWPALRSLRCLMFKSSVLPSGSWLSLRAYVQQVGLRLEVSAGGSPGKLAPTGSSAAFCRRRDGARPSAAWPALRSLRCLMFKSSVPPCGSWLSLRAYVQNRPVSGWRFRRVDRQASWLLRVPARLSAADETELGLPFGQFGASLGPKLPGAALRIFPFCRLPKGG
jgi:hypothetical protein